MDTGLLRKVNEYLEDSNVKEYHGWDNIEFGVHALLISHTYFKNETPSKHTLSDIDILQRIYDMIDNWCEHAYPKV